MLAKSFAVSALLLTIVAVTPALAQWQPDQRLTDNAGESRTSLNNAWSVAATGDTVHVVWWDMRDGREEIYYKRSTDGGATWGSDTRLTYAIHHAVYPCVAVAGPVVHVVWCDARDVTDSLHFEIYYKRSTDGGATWDADTRLTYDPNISIYPSVAVAGDLVHLVWVDARDYYYEGDDGANSVGFWVVGSGLLAVV